jgi:hypothetical protein
MQRLPSAVDIQFSTNILFLWNPISPQPRQTFLVTQQEPQTKVCHTRQPSSLHKWYLIGDTSYSMCKDSLQQLTFNFPLIFCSYETPSVHSPKELVVGQSGKVKICMTNFCVSFLMQSLKCNSCFLHRCARCLNYVTHLDLITLWILNQRWMKTPVFWNMKLYGLWPIYRVYQQRSAILQENVI